MEENNEHFFYNEEKLNFLMNYLKINTQEVAKLFGVNTAYISKLRNQDHNSLKDMHIYAFTAAFNIPFEVFNKKVKTSEKIIQILEDTKQQEKQKFFRKNEKRLQDSSKQEILDKLIGTWYMYSYPSNPNLTDIWETKTVFHTDYRVIDEHKNEGTLYIGKNQCIVLKESAGSKNITSITFDNSRIFYNVFLFSRVSKSNGMNKEIFNFGICSRNKLNKENLKKVLGKVNQVQLQINYEILERINLLIGIEN